MGDSHVGLQARLMSQALRKLTGGLSQTNTTMIFINQIRKKIGVMFGSPETTTGGNALKFYASVRLDIRRIEALKDGTDVVGNRTRVKVVKNKMAPPFRRPSSTSSTASASPARAASSTSASTRPSSRSRVRGTRTTATSWARARRTPATSCCRTPTSPPTSSRRSSSSWASASRRSRRCRRRMSSRSSPSSGARAPEARSADDRGGECRERRLVRATRPGHLPAVGARAATAGVRAEPVGPETFDEPGELEEPDELAEPEEPRRGVRAARRTPLQRMPDIRRERGDVR